MENVLEISKLNKSYTDFSLTDVSFSLPDNSITGFIGVNGSGKTTMDRGFIGLTNRPKKIAGIMPDALMERPTIENIMLGEIEKGNASWQL